MFDKRSQWHFIKDSGEETAFEIERPCRRRHVAREDSLALLRLADQYKRGPEEGVAVTGVSDLVSGCDEGVEFG
ncbi:MAG: hypothetical protein ACP5M0_11170, partial [Desulfomonilaceae bacterium]